MGEIYSVCYDAVNAMLLNEFLKESAAQSSNWRNKWKRLLRTYRS